MYILDLDGTVINSYHRTVNALIAGQFCLETYIRECNTEELINADTLLPLAKFMQHLARTGEAFAIMTARYMTDIDRAFLVRHGLVNDLTISLSRDTVSKEIRALGDAEYKLKQFEGLQSHFSSIKHFVMFDDMPDIITAMGSLPNVTCIDAVALNNALEHKADILQQSDTVSAFTAFSQSATRDQFDAFLTDSARFAV